MNINVIVNIGLLMQRIREKGYHGFSDAAAHCRTSSKNFQKLAHGEIPRLDALQRICRGLGISESELIISSTIKRDEQAKVTRLELPPKQHSNS